MKEFRILVCGGREYGWKWEDGFRVPDQEQRRRFDRVLENCIRTYRERHPAARIVIIHGAAKGADTLAHDFVVSSRRSSSDVLRDIHEESYPANWKEHGRAAGPIRNQHMLTTGKPDVIIAFEGGEGTAHMVKIGRKSGVTVYEVKV